MKRAGLIGVAALAFGGAAFAQDAEILGWTFEPEIAEGNEGGELDRLSRSPSGALGTDIYGGGADDPRVAVSVTLRALDKITARYTDLEVPIGEEASFGSLTLLPRTCNKRPPEEFPETTVFLQVFPTQRDVQGRRIRAQLGTGDGAERDGAIVLPGERRSTNGTPLFSGWMFASSPALNALEHPVYDVWVIDCKMEMPET